MRVIGGKIIDKEKGSNFTRVSKKLMRDNFLTTRDREKGNISTKRETDTMESGKKIKKVEKE